MFFPHLIFYLGKDHSWQLAGAFDQEDLANTFWYTVRSKYPDMIFKWIYYNQALGVVLDTNAPKGVDYD